MTPIHEFKRYALREIINPIVCAVNGAEISLGILMDRVREDFEEMGCPDGVTDAEYADEFVNMYEILVADCGIESINRRLREVFHYSLICISEIAELPECPYRDAAETIRNMS